MNKTIRLSLLGAAIAAMTLLAGCGSRQDGTTTVRVWAHQGQEAENLAMRDIVEAFNREYDIENIRAEIHFFPDYQYAEKIATAAAAADLPDVMDLDGPTVAQFVEAGLLEPLTGLFDQEELADFLPTILAQGTIDNTLYALGAFDSALVLYYDKDMLEAAGVRTPGGSTPWTWDEFLDACARLKAASFDPVTLHMNESADEWYTYAFSPVIWSAGGDLMDEQAARVAGVLDSPQNVAALREWQRLFTGDYAAAAPVEPNPFGAGQTAMDWTGHWMARAHIEAKGERLGVMPLPVIDKQVAACGSWCWGMLSTTRDKDAAALFLRWVLSAEKGVIPIVRANGAVPARLSAFPAFPEYEQPPYRLFKELLTEFGRPRPRTPRYAALTRNFAAALRDVARGADPADALARAAAQTQTDIRR